MPFSWANQKDKTQKHLLARYILLAKSNIDFQVRYPDLAREIEKGVSLTETKKLVDKVIKKHFKYGQTPKSSIIPKRMNRIV